MIHDATTPQVMGNSAAQVCCYLVDDSAALGNPCGRENWSERFGVVGRVLSFVMHVLSLSVPLYFSCNLNIYIQSYIL